MVNVHLSITAVDPKTNANVSANESLTVKSFEEAKEIVKRFQAEIELNNFLKQNTLNKRLIKKTNDEAKE